MTETIWCVSELRKTRNSVPLNFGLIFSCQVQKRSLSKKQSRQLGTWHVPARCVYSLKEFTYLWHLHIYGILKCPDTCPKCGTGGMQGPFARKDVGTEHLHWHSWKLSYHFFLLRRYFAINYAKSGKFR